MGDIANEHFEFDFDSGNQTVQIDMESPEPEMNAPLQMVIPLDFNKQDWRCDDP